MSHSLIILARDHPDVNLYSINCTGTRLYNLVHIVQCFISSANLFTDNNIYIDILVQSKTTYKTYCFWGSM